MHDDVPPADRTTDTVSATNETSESQLTLPLRLQYTCTARETAEASDLLLTDSFGGSPVKVGLVVVGPVIAGGAALLLRTPPEHRLTMVIAVAAVSVLVVFLQKFIQRNRNSSGEANPVSTDHEVLSDGIRMRAGDSVSMVAATGCDKLLQSENLFVIRTGQLGLIFPKRVFEDDAQRAAFAGLVEEWTDRQDLSPVPGGSDFDHDQDAIRFVWRPSFRDYVDRFLNSWRPRIFILGTLTLMVGALVFAIATAEPVANPVHSNLEFALFALAFAVPFLTGMAFVVFVLWAWWTERSIRVDIDVAVSHQGIRLTDPITSTEIGWNTPSRFKESRATIYVWWPGTETWIAMPKRDFQSESDETRCRELLTTYSEPSTWYWG